MEAWIKIGGLHETRQLLTVEKTTTLPVQRAGMMVAQELE